MSDDIDPDAFREFERIAHDRLAESYHAFFASVTAHAAEPLLTAASVGPGMTVLDAACGSGVVGMRAARLGAVVTGVDLAPRMLAQRAISSAASPVSALCACIVSPRVLRLRRAE